ncbi:hypothetical protein L1987_16223 [Smallanthus sonchifolius]|uniref:Uncharacterized protein n=1 Tax=Smallanthus sonchifolius TaxID=185202 RepID=A0ACB9JB78_9ASTR|nr:hypothetical protein L1987_16223 [Smallanthus sonchifolius]
MSPRKFLDGDHKQQTKSGIVINGTRPTPLKIKQESHTINKHHHHQPPQIRKPIIIYIRSPKVIHTKPYDFLALVQRLTGRSGSKDHEQQPKKTLEGGYDLNENEFYNDSGVAHERNSIVKSRSPMFNTPWNPYVADIPLSTPNTSDYFFSPGSLVEFMKRLPEY